MLSLLFPNLKPFTDSTLTAGRSLHFLMEHARQAPYDLSSYLCHGHFHTQNTTRTHYAILYLSISTPPSTLLADSCSSPRSISSVTILTKFPNNPLRMNCSVLCVSTPFCAEFKVPRIFKDTVFIYWKYLSLFLVL